MQIIHIIRRSKPLSDNPIVYHHPDVSYAIVVNGKLQSIIE